MRTVTEAPPLEWGPDAREHARKVALGLREALAGKLNNTGRVTLDQSPATTTVVPALGCTPDSVVLLVPEDAPAANEVAGFSPGMLVYVVPGVDEFTVHHSAQAFDRGFGYAVLG